MSNPDTISVERRGFTGFITLERPQLLNIVDSAVLKRLGETLSDLDKDGAVRVVVITGRKHFSAGADIRELKDKDPAQAEAFARLGHCICNAIEGMKKPVIAAVSGYALGAGCEIALACDIRIASEGARFGQPEVNLGIIPGFGGTQRLAGLVGIGRAKELIFSGRIIEAAEAAGIGLVNKVVKEDDLIKTAEKMAAEYSEKSLTSLRLVKTLINQHRKFKGEFEEEISSFVECFESDDHREGISAFLEKRRPEFRGM